jgi:hypothetical protein
MDSISLEAAEDVVSGEISVLEVAGISTDEEP